MVAMPSISCKVVVGASQLSINVLLSTAERGMVIRFAKKLIRNFSSLLSRFPLFLSEKTCSKSKCDVSLYCAKKQANFVENFS